MFYPPPPSPDLLQTPPGNQSGIATRNQKCYDRLIESREILSSLEFSRPGGWDNYGVSCPWEKRWGRKGRRKKISTTPLVPPRRRFARERKREREKKETRFRRILNDSLTHQTVPSFLLGPKLREFFLNYSRTAYGNYLGPPPRAFKSQSWKTCPFIVFRGA